MMRLRLSEARPPLALPPHWLCMDTLQVRQQAHAANVHDTLLSGSAPAETSKVAAAHF